MKTIIIAGQRYDYEEIKEIRDVLKAQEVVVSLHVELGDHVSLDKGVVLETAAKVGEYSVLQEGSRIGTDAKVGAGCIIGKDSYIKSCAELGNYVTIGENVVIGDEAIVLPNTTLLKSILIRGSIAEVTYTGNNRIAIGCVNNTIPYLKQHSQAIGKQHGYTAANIQEYLGHIETIENFIKENK